MPERDSMQNRSVMTIGAIVTAGLLQAQGPGMNNAAWMKFQDKLTPVKEYSATLVMEVSGQTITSKMFQSGKKTRTEIATQGMQIISITDPEADDGKGAMYMLMPVMKTYTKMPFPADAAGQADKEPDIKIEEIGKEDVDGVSCDKRRVTITADGKEQVMTMWLSAAAKNMPVKMEMAAPTAVVIKYKDYDFKKPSADLFTVPADYKANAMMNLGGGAPTIKQ